MSKNPLSKNFVYKDKPRNELEGLLANMHGENYPVEAKNGLIKEASKIPQGSALPDVTSADNGKVLGVVDGAWAADEKRFVVTCTPTGPDYSGTMDKTSAEIDEAWNSGKIIWFKVGSSTSPLALRSEGAEGNSYSAYIINENMRALIMATTNVDSNTYEATIYQLTPLGS